MPEAVDLSGVGLSRAARGHRLSVAPRCVVLAAVGVVHAFRALRVSPRITAEARGGPKARLSGRPEAGELSAMILSLSGLAGPRLLSAQKQLRRRQGARVR